MGDISFYAKRYGNIPTRSHTQNKMILFHTQGGAHFLLFYRSCPVIIKTVLVWHKALGTEKRPKFRVDKTKKKGKFLALFGLHVVATRRPKTKVDPKTLGDGWRGGQTSNNVFPHAGAGQVYLVIGYVNFPSCSPNRVTGEDLLSDEQWGGK